MLLMLTAQQQQQQWVRLSHPKVWLAGVSVGLAAGSAGEVGASTAAARVLPLLLL
jgi:hypothetical protein